MVGLPHGGRLRPRPRDCDKRRRCRRSIRRLYGQDRPVGDRPAWHGRRHEDPAARRTRPHHRRRLRLLRRAARSEPHRRDAGGGRRPCQFIGLSSSSAGCPRTATGRQQPVYLSGWNGDHAKDVLCVGCTFGRTSRRRCSSASTPSGRALVIRSSARASTSPFGAKSATPVNSGNVCRPGIRPQVCQFPRSPDRRSGPRRVAWLRHAPHSTRASCGTAGTARVPCTQYSASSAPQQRTARRPTACEIWKGARMRLLHSSPARRRSSVG